MNLWGDFRYSVRSLRRTPAFTAIAVVTLTIGIGINIAIFSLYEQILFRPLPVPEPGRLVNLIDQGPDIGGSRSSNQTGGVDSIFSYPMFRDLERRQQPFAGIAAHRIFDASISTGERARRSSGVLVSGSYFPALGLRPSLGRLLGPQDDRVDGRAESVVLSDAYWRNEFAGDPGVVGRELIVNGTPLTIVGVTPPGFHGTTAGTRAGVFVPITFRWSEVPGAIPDYSDRSHYWVYLFARLAPGIGLEEAEAAINPLYRGILGEFDAPLQTGADEESLEAFRTKSLELEPGERGQSSTLSYARERLAMLLAVSGGVLLLCCANLTGLMLARGAARGGEMAIRISIGATHRRLASLLLSESLLLALPAGVASLLVGHLTLRLVRAIPGFPWAAFDVDLDLGAACVAIGIAIASALASSLFPTLSLIRSDPSGTLQAYGVRQTSAKGVTRFRTALATAQIALAMALLATVGVFAQSLARIGNIDLGLAVDSVVTFSISPESGGYDPDASAELFGRLETELATLPGVVSVASSMVPLLSSSVWGTTASADTEQGTVRADTYINLVSTGFFRTLNIGLLAGREFATTDSAGAPEVAVVNRRFAEKLGLGSDVVGRHVRVGGADVEIVGLAADSKYDSVTSEIGPQAFRPRGQSGTLGTASFYVRSSRPQTDMMRAIRDAVDSIDPLVPIVDLRTMQQQAHENLAMQRFAAGASTAFAALATALAGLGLYGVLAYSVAQRSREIGLRFALGAPAGRIRGMVVRQVAVMAVFGIALGTAAAWLIGRAARGLLFGVEAGDPVAVAGAAIVVVAVTLGAAYVPARRASGVDPMVVLRYE